MVIIPNVHFSFRKGGGSAPEILYGKVELKPTLAFQASTSLVLPAPTTIDLVDGEGTASNVYPTPAPVEGQIEWAYRVKVTDRHSKSFEWMVGVPDVTGTVEFTSLPKYYETRPPAFGKGDKGDPGTAATIAVGTVSGGTTASVTNSGTNTDAVLDFVLPKGDKGDKGDGVPAGGTALQYIRKDAANTTTEWATLNKAAVGLSNVDNTSDANKPVSTAQANAISNTNILANFTKTLSDAPTTYPQGVSVTRAAQSAGWPGDSGVSSDLVVIVTQRSSGFGGGASQWVYQYNNPQEAPRYRVGASNDTWGEFEEIQTRSVTGILSVTDFGIRPDTGEDLSDKIIVAVEAAASSGHKLYWPEGAYTTTKSIPGLHKVRHSGGGRITRGSDVFYLAPENGQTNTIYCVSGGGSNTFDGISSGQSIVSLQTAVNILSNYSDTVLSGNWVFKLAAGTYNSTAIIPEGLVGTGMVTFEGPQRGHPNIPTAVISRGHNFSGYGIFFRNGSLQVTVRDILFYGFNGTASSAGITNATNDREWFLENTHFTECYWGASSQSSKLNVKGGIYRGCGFLGGTAEGTPISARSGNGAGIRSLMQNRHSIGTQNAGVLTYGPYFYDSQCGLFAQEFSTGHFDWSRVEGCGTGVTLTVNSRANCDGSYFAKNTTDISATFNSHFFVSTNNTFGAGSNASGRRYRVASGARHLINSGQLFSEMNTSLATPSYSYVRELVDTTISSTSAQAVKTLTVVPEGMSMIPSSASLPDVIKVKITGSCAGTSGYKRINVRYGGQVNNVTFTATEVGSFVVEAEITLYTNTTYTNSMEAKLHLANNRISNVTRTYSASASNELRIEGQVESAGNTITVSTVEIISSV